MNQLLCGSSVDLTGPFRRTIDFMKFSSTTMTTEPHALQRDGVIIAFRPKAHKEEVPSVDTIERRHSTDSSARQVARGYMVVFGYGSVVFFNVDDEKLQKQYLEQVKPFCSSLLLPQRTEDYGLEVSPGLDSWAEVAHDKVILQELDLRNVRVISGILGLSVALDYYDVMAEHMLSGFSRMNAEIESHGRSTISKKELFKWVAANNSIHTDAVQKLALLDRSETAWRYPEYGVVWEKLRMEFELEKRFANFGYKLDLVHENTKFFLEVAQHQNSGRLEWIIIWLIAAEVV